MNIRLHPGQVMPCWYRLPWGSSAFVEQAAGAGHCDRWDVTTLGESCGDYVVPVGTQLGLFRGAA